GGGEVVVAASQVEKPDQIKGGGEEVIGRIGGRAPPAGALRTKTAPGAYRLRVRIALPQVPGPVTPAGPLGVMVLVKENPVSGWMVAVVSDATSGFSV